MTTDQIETLRTLHAAATPGPWFGSAGGRYVYGATPGDEVAVCVRRHDADLVRATVNALPDLLAIAEAHQTLVTNLEDLCAGPPIVWNRGMYGSPDDMVSVTALRNRLRMFLDARTDDAGVSS